MLSGRELLFAPRFENNPQQLRNGLDEGSLCLADCGALSQLLLGGLLKALGSCQLQSQLIVLQPPASAMLRERLM